MTSLLTNFKFINLPPFILPFLANFKVEDLFTWPKDPHEGKC